ncbi:hypothetical protein BH20ACT15_BH20ACT15_09070 [soil metagenome]
MKAADWSEVVDDPVFAMRMRFAQRDDDVLLVELWADPGGGVSVAHYHPVMEERFEVLEGEVKFTADGDDVIARPGDPAVVVKPGVRHKFENVGETEAHVMTEADPGDPDLQEFLTRAAALARQGAYTRRGIPRGLGHLMEAADFAERYRDSTVLTGPAFPPPRLQPLLLGPLAWLHRRRRAA